MNNNIISKVTINLFKLSEKYQVSIHEETPVLKLPHEKSFFFVRDKKLAPR